MRQMPVVAFAALLASAVADDARTLSIAPDAFQVKSGWELRGGVLTSTAAGGEAAAEFILPKGDFAVWVRLKGTIKATVNGQGCDLGEGGSVEWKHAGRAGGRTSLLVSASAPKAEVYGIMLTSAFGYTPLASEAGTVARQDGLALWLDFDDEDAFRCRDRASGGEAHSRRAIMRAKGPWGGALRCLRAGLKLEDSPSIAGAAGAMTASAWVQADATDSYRTILFKGERMPAFQAVHFDLDLFDGRPEFKFKDPAGVWQGLYRNGPYEVTPVKIGEWSHVAATFEKGMVRLYVNGREAGSHKTFADRLVPNGFPLRVGQGLSETGAEAYPFAGLIDDAKVYSRALAPQEVSDEYEAGRATHPPGAAAVEKQETYEPDPKFERKLKLVEAYEKNIPQDVIANAKTTASVQVYQGTPALHINGKPVFPMAMIPIGHFPKDACRDFAAAGVHLYSQIIWNWQPGFLTPEVDWWLGPGQYDFAKIDRQILSIIEADPQAYIFLRVKLNPAAWWVKANPDELACREDGTRAPQCSLASEAWEETYERMLRDLIRHIEGSPYAGHIIGYQPAGGEASEWYWWGHDKGLIDYGPTACKRFRKWLRERYHSDAAALQKAWNDPQVSFETALPPKKEAREASECMLFRDASKAGQVMDFLRFLSSMTARNIVRSCRICKEETGGKKITGVFYGYSLYAAPKCVYNLGFLGLKGVLDSPYVDFLCSPTDYARRRGGEPGNFVSAYTASYLLHGKLYWDEADIRTHLYRGRETYAAKSLPETLAVFERGFGYMLTKGTALWWFTLTGDHTWHQEEMMEDIARMQKIGEAGMADSKEHVRDAAVLVDEETFFHMRMGTGELTSPLLLEMHNKLAVMGAPFDLYLMSDIADERMPDYKLYLFLNPFYVSDAMREAVKKKTRRNGAVSVWFYAPGFIKEDGTFSEEAMRDLTGIHLRHRLEERPLDLTVTDFAHPTLSEVDRSDVFDRTQKLGPIFYADDPDAAVLGRMLPNGEAGMVVRDFGTWRSVYCATPAVPTAVLRGLVRYAGGHVYSTSDDVLYANRNYLMLHTVTGGKKHIALPDARDVYDALQGQLVGRALSSIDTELPDGVTRIYRLVRPER